MVASSSQSKRQLSPAARAKMRSDYPQPKFSTPQLLEHHGLSPQSVSPPARRQPQSGPQLGTPAAPALTPPAISPPVQRSMPMMPENNFSPPQFMPEIPRTPPAAPPAAPQAMPRDFTAEAMGRLADQAARTTYNIGRLPGSPVAAQNAQLASQISQTVDDQVKANQVGMMIRQPAWDKPLPPPRSSDTVYRDGRMMQTMGAGGELPQDTRDYAAFNTSMPVNETVRQNQLARREEKQASMARAMDAIRMRKQQEAAQAQQAQQDMPLRLGMMLAQSANPAQAALGAELVRSVYGANAQLQGTMIDTASRQAMANQAIKGQSDLATTNNAAELERTKLANQNQMEIAKMQNQTQQQNNATQQQQLSQAHAVNILRAQNELVQLQQAQQVAKTQAEAELIRNQIEQKKLDIADGLAKFQQTPQYQFGQAMQNVDPAVMMGNPMLLQQYQNYLSSLLPQSQQSNPSLGSAGSEVPYSQLASQLQMQMQNPGLRTAFPDFQGMDPMGISQQIGSLMDTPQMFDEMTADALQQAMMLRNRMDANYGFNNAAQGDPLLGAIMNTPASASLVDALRNARAKAAEGKKKSAKESNEAAIGWGSFGGVGF